MAIPKILHYCWFGKGEMPKISKKCFKSWKKYLGDFEFRIHDESNFDIHINKYVEQAYNAKKYMYVSDYARLLSLYNEGGLYFDVDCLVKKDFSPLLETNYAFTGFGGDNKEIAACTMAFEKGNEFIKECLDSYENDTFIREDGSYNLKSINIRMTELLEKYGFIPNGKEQKICGIKIYPMTYFCPLSMLPDTVPDCKSKNTYSLTIWTGKSLKRERSFLVRFAHKTGLNKIKRKIVNILKGKK